MNFFKIRRKLQRRSQLPRFFFHRNGFHIEDFSVPYYSTYISLLASQLISLTCYFSNNKHLSKLIARIVLTLFLIPTDLEGA
jgi:hypothetical protein